MKAWFQSIGSKIRIWMQGRYGMDELSRASTWIALALIILSSLTGLNILNTLAVVLMIWSIFRTYSKNIYKRREERDNWLRMTGSAKSWFSLQKRKWKDRKDYRYFCCKQCKSVMRVPKGKGTVIIRCRKCHSEITKKI